MSNAGSSSTSTPPDPSPSPSPSSSTSTSTTPASASQDSESRTTQTPPTNPIDTIALALLFVTPPILAIPPRRLNFASLTLSSLFLLSANQITLSKTGESIPEHLGRRWPGGSPAARARERQAQRERNKLESAQDLGIPVKGEHWAERRAREDRERLEAGEGYFDIITDQIWEVWTWGRGLNRGSGELGDRSDDGGEKKG